MATHACNPRAHFFLYHCAVSGKENGAKGLASCICVSVSRGALGEHGAALGWYTGHRLGFLAASIDGSCPLATLGLRGINTLAYVPPKGTSNSPKWQRKGARDSCASLILKSPAVYTPHSWVTGHICRLEDLGGCQVCGILGSPLGCNLSVLQMILISLRCSRPDHHTLSPDMPPWAAIYQNLSSPSVCQSIASLSAESAPALSQASPSHRSLPVHPPLTTPCFVLWCWKRPPTYRML